MTGIRFYPWPQVGYCEAYQCFAVCQETKYVGFYLQGSRCNCVSAGFTWSRTICTRTTGGAEFSQRYSWTRSLDKGQPGRSKLQQVKSGPVWWPIPAVMWRLVLSDDMIVYSVRKYPVIIYSRQRSVTIMPDFVQSFFSNAQ